MLAQIVDHASRARSRMLSQYQGLPVFGALVAQLGTVAQGVEDALWGLIAMTAIPTASGIWLDWLGGIVGEGRGSLIDADYRVMIHARIFANLTRGRIDDVNNVINTWGGGTEVFTLTEYFPAAMLIFITSPVLDTDEKLERIRQLLRSTRAGGVGLMLRYNTSAAAGLVMSDAASGADVTHGMSDEATPLVGGLAGGAVRTT